MEKETLLLTPLMVRNLLVKYGSIDFKCYNCADHRLAESRGYEIVTGEDETRYARYGLRGFSFSSWGDWGSIYQWADDDAINFFTEIINSGIASLWRFNYYKGEQQCEDCIQDVDLTKYEKYPDNIPPKPNLPGNWIWNAERQKWVRYRIRKLTPKECFRLMGVRDEYIDKIQLWPVGEDIKHPSYSKEERIANMTDDEKRMLTKSGISESQQYKLAGNSIVVDVLFHIYTNLFIKTDKPKDTLF